MPKYKDIKDKKFNNLIVKERAESNYRGDAQWWCECICGNPKRIKVKAANLTSGNTRSCGCLKENFQKWNGFGEISGSYWYMIGCHAKTKNRELTITIQYAWELFLKQNRKCVISGVELTFVRDYRNQKHLQTASLDRIDSSLGYVEGNVQWIHKDVNNMKSNWHDKKLIDWCKTITEYQRSLSMPDSASVS